jgi:hypothetical protein
MKTLKFLPLLSCFLLFGCNDFWECLIDRRPELESKTFPIGSTETYYYVDVSAEIKNEPRDNDYDYFFEFAEPLPDGLDFFVNYRTISIEGTPEVTGTYQIVLNLFVDGPFRDGFGEEDSELCEYNTSKTYTLIIE